MGVGTPGFEGARLKEALKARDCTPVLLAELIGKTPQAIYKYEQNAASPAPHVLEAIARALNMPLPYFTQKPRLTQQKTVFFRSMSAASKRARERAKCKLEWLQDIVAYLKEYIELPPVNLPEFTLSKDPANITPADIENLAEDLRRYWGMSTSSPVGNMVALMENQGVLVSRHYLEAEALDSLSVVKDGQPYILVGADKGSAVRWRFDVAHELGHLLLHRQVTETQLIKLGYHKKTEEQAHRFARSFLLPLEAFGDDLIAADLDVLRAMKPKWKVSIAAMIMRARDAGLLSEQSEKRLWINLSRRGWRRQEPYDNNIEAEEARLLRRAMDMLLTSGIQTAADVTSHLRLSPVDIEDLIGLPRDYLQRDFSPAPSLRSSIYNEREKGWAQPPADVITLPLRKNKGGLD